MAKRFVDTERHRISMRGVDPKIRLAFEWLWQNCDAAGVWAIDMALFKFELGYPLNVEGLLKSCPTLQRLPNGALYHTDFVEVNYGLLKPGYNPHKPVFRSLEANGIDPATLQIQDLGNPSPRVEEEGKEEDTSTQGKEHASAQDETPPPPKPPKAKKGPNPNIQAVIDHLTAELREKSIARSLDADEVNGGDGNRYFASHLLHKIAKDYPEHETLPTVLALISAATSDPFHKNNCTKVRYLYNNCGRLIANAIARKTNPKTQTDGDRQQQLAAELAKRAEARASGNVQAA